VRKQIIAPAAEEAGAPWAGWHTFRHTCASLLIAEGRNIVHVQRWLGHSSPDVTWRRYAHLMPGELGDALELDGLLAAPAVELLH
jgi:integrase